MSVCPFEPIYMAEGETVIPTMCPICNQKKHIVVRTLDFVKWQAQYMFIQDAFPYLSVDDREAIKTGYCPPCWDKTMGPDE